MTDAITTIVVGVDRTPAARNAAALGAALAAQFDARLCLVHGVEFLAHGPPNALDDEELVRELFEHARVHLARERRARHDHGPGDLVEAVRLGRAAHEVLAFAEESGAELIIVGTRSEPGRHRLEEHSVAGELIKTARVPVLVVHDAPLPERAPGTPVFVRPLAAVDFGDASRASLQTAALLARGACLDVVHVVAPGATPPAGDAPSLGRRARALTDAENGLRRWLASALPEESARSHGHVLTGRPAPALVDFAVGGGHDLVACGAAHWHGSVAESLLDAVPCPVLVRREAA